MKRWLVLALAVCLAVPIAMAGAQEATQSEPEDTTDRGMLMNQGGDGSLADVAPEAQVKITSMPCSELMPEEEQLSNSLCTVIDPKDADAARRDPGNYAPNDPDGLTALEEQVCNSRAKATAELPEQARAELPTDPCDKAAAAGGAR